MASISDRAAQLRDCCLNNGTWPASLLEDVVRDTRDPEGSRAFFTTVIEPLGDLFEPRLCDVYARLFSQAIERPELAERYFRIRQPRVCTQSPQRVYVLSRVTIGADIAVTSVMLDAAKRRFPDAEIHFVGPRKNWELFAGDPRILLHESPYARSGLLADRIAAKPELDLPDSIVIDPDSRLSQLGILPVCRDENYYFFESRSYGGDSTETLSRLTARWVAETFGIEDAKPWIALAGADGDTDAEPHAAAVSLGVGENPAKCFDLRFESKLLALLPDNTCIDLGGSNAEAQRVRSAARRAQALFQGPFAGFAAIIAKSGFFAGYDSAGGHTAAALGVPMISIFRGAVSDRMFERWKPSGPGEVNVLRADWMTASDALEKVSCLLRGRW